MSGGKGGFSELRHTFPLPPTFTARFKGPAGLYKALGTVCWSPRTQAYLADGDPLQSHTYCRQVSGTEDHRPASHPLANTGCGTLWAENPGAGFPSEQSVT